MHVLCVYWSIIISKKPSFPMINELLKKKTFVKEIQSQTLDLIQYSDVEKEIEVFINEELKNKIILRLYEQTIVIFTDQKLYSEPLGQFQMDFSLRFERIFEENKIEYQGQTQKKLRIIGFRYEDSQSQLSFYIKEPLEASRWINQMSSNLNQVGFHKFYKPVKMLGKGSSASVYEVIKIDDGQRLAAKVFSRQKLKINSKSYNSFISQVQILREICHENVIEMTEVYESDNSYYIMMEHLKGGNLFQYLVMRQKALTVDEIKIIMQSILKGLHYLQIQDIVHRDVKLENLMLRNKDNLQIVIGDFGLAVHSDDQDYSYYHCGTPGYLSPEAVQLDYKGRLTTKSDVFSAGAVFHILLTGKFLFEGRQEKSIFENNKKMDFDLEKQEYNGLDKTSLSLLKKMLTLNPSERLKASQCLKHQFFTNFPTKQIVFCLPCETRQIDLKF